MNILGLTTIFAFAVFLAEARPQDDWIWSTRGPDDGTSFRPDWTTSRYTSRPWTTSRYTSPWTSNPWTTQTPSPTTTGVTSTPFNEGFWRCTRNCPSLSQYNPVCGTNRQTYDNIQKLNCAKSCGENVDVLFYGKCQRREITTSTTGASVFLV